MKIYRPIPEPPLESPELKYKPYLCPSCFDVITFGRVAQSFDPNLGYVCLACIQEELAAMPTEDILKLMHRPTFEAWEMVKEASR